MEAFVQCLHTETRGYIIREDVEGIKTQSICTIYRKFDIPICHTWYVDAISNTSRYLVYNKQIAFQR